MDERGVIVGAMGKVKPKDNAKQMLKTLKQKNTAGCIAVQPAVFFAFMMNSLRLRR